MARAVLFMWNPRNGKTLTDVFSTPEHADPVAMAHALRDSCRDDFPGALWGVGADEEAIDIMATNRMRAMGFEDYDHATAQGHKPSVPSTKENDHA